MQFLKTRLDSLNIQINKKTSARKALVLALIASSVLSVTPAIAANSLFELFQQRRQQAQKPTPEPVPGVATPQASKPASVSRATTPVKRVTVSAPKAYDYKPDALVKIDFSQIDLRTTSSIHPITDGMSPIGSKPVGTMASEFDSIAEYLAFTDVMAEKAIAKALVDYYTDKRSLLWSADAQVLEKARDVVALFAQADEDGLAAEEYAVTIPSRHFESDDLVARQKRLAQFEIQLSARALRYALDAGEGRIIANRLSGFHDLPRNRIDLREVLDRLASGDAAAYLKGLHPQNAAYAALKRELAEMGEPEDEPIKITLEKSIRPGDESKELAKVISLIKRHAPQDFVDTHMAVLDAHASASQYDLELEPVIKGYQSLSGNKPDGVIGKMTVAALQAEQNSIKRDRILYSMERMRWLPHDFGLRYVMVNQPSYRAEYFEDGHEKLAMNVVIGSPKHQTYFFYDEIKTVVFNPSWGVPRSIILNEMLPKVMRDSSYLDRNGYEVYVQGRKVSSSSVNWHAVTQGKAHVGVRQKPGANNALGELKILFPNTHDIYMHDTPSKSYFSRDMRALSHGCIRLENPRAMAAAVLGRSVDDITQYFGKNERGLKVQEPVPVYLTYFTAWPNSSGEILYYNDVYKRDEGLEKASEKTRQSRLASI